MPKVTEGKMQNRTGGGQGGGDPTFPHSPSPQFRVVASVLRHDASYRSFFHRD